MANDTFSLNDVAEVLPEPAAPAATTSFQPGDIAEVLPDEGALTVDGVEVAEELPGTGPRNTSLDEFRTKSDADLEKDSDFNPVLFGSQNRDALLNDPASFDKLTRVYRAKETKGTTLGQKLKALVKGTPGAIYALGTGIEKAVGRGLELTPVAVAARAAGAASVEGGKGASKELKEARGKMAEVDASIEAAAAGSGDLVRRSGRAVVEGAGKVLPGIESKAEKSDDEWKNRFREDVAGLEQTEAVNRGSGEVMKALGSDAESLAKVGIKLDPQAIQELSVVTDPINFIPFGAAVGAVSKISGKIVNRTIATALDAEQAAKLAATLNQARTVASNVGEVASKTAGAVTEVAGRGVQKVGEVAEKTVRALGGAGGGVGLGGLIGGDVVSALGGGAVAKAGPRIVQATGRGLEAAGEMLSGTRAVPTSLKVAGEIGSDIAKGTAEGAVLAIPFALGARPDEEEAVLGAAGVGGLARAGVNQLPRAAKAVGKVAQDKLAETIFREVELADAPPSSTYGTDPNLDTIHEATAAKLDTRSQKLLNWTREAFRDSGIEVYALDDASFARKAGTGDAYGFSMNLGERLDPQGNATPVVQILLNGNTDALPHELFHALTEIDPKAAKQLSDSVIKSWTPEQKAYFTELYNTLRNGGKPKEQWKHVLDEAGIAEEAGAEVFSRLFLGQDLSNVSPSITKQAATFASSILEKLGAPLGGVAMQRGTPGVSTLGVRPGAESAKVGQQWLQNISERLQTRGNLLSETPARSKLLSNATPEDIQLVRTPPAAPVVTPPKPLAPPSVAPRAVTPKPAPATPPRTGARNIRVTREQQNDFAAKRAAETGVESARAAQTSPEVKQHIDTISKALETGSGVVEIEHRGVKTDSTAEGRTARRAEQEAAYIAEGAANAPTDIREAYQKTFVPVRWENVKGKPQLLAMSLDKVIANVHRVIKDSAAKNVADKIPYEVVDGKLTDNGWGQVVDDLQAYTANQANGYRGDGNKLIRPTTDINVSIPAENPAYNPVKLTEERMNFLNLVQGLNPPLTARVSKGTPGNVKGQVLAELQGKTPEKPSVIRPEDITKQEFKGTGRSIKETNPLRNELAAAGVPVRELIEVTERINSDDIVTSTARPDINFSAPVTDTIRAGFLPGKETLNAPTPSPEIRDLAERYAKSAGVDYRPAQTYAPLNEDLGKRLADFYDNAVSTPDDPAVVASYKALADETVAQYKAITDAGYTIEPFEGQGEPYKSSAEAVKDIRDNKHLYFLKTENAFGRGAETPAKNPLLADAGNGLVVNDIFRGVHDFFGHGKEGYQFGPRGEFNAWRTHSEMYSPEAQGALAAETLAQNSWVNFGKHLRDEAGNVPKKGEPGFVPQAERPFGEQKNTLVPQELIDEARAAAGKFLPDNKSVKEFGEELLKAPATEFKPAMDALGGLTNGAWDLGMNLKNVEDVAVLKDLSERAAEQSKTLIQAGDFSAAMPMVMKGQFFREAYESATGTASVKKAWESGRMPEGYKPPFPEAAVEGKALPKTEKGIEQFEKRGVDFKISGQPGVRSVDIFRKGEPIGNVQSTQRTPTSAEIVSASLKKGERGQGVAEAAYRELLTQLKDDGATEVGGMIVARQPLEIRKKIFGDFDRLEGPDGPVSLDEARKILTDGAFEEFTSGIEAFNKIAPDMKFLPAPEGTDGVKEAAIRTPSGKVYTGAWHGDALMKFVDAISQGLTDEKPPKGVKTLSEMLEGDIPEGYIEDGFVTESGKFLNRAEALDHAEKIGQIKTDAKPGRGSFQEAGILESNEFEGKRNFLPKEKRNAQGQPLDADGLVDYEKLYKELSAAKAKQTAKGDKALDVKISKGKYKMPEGSTSKTKLTGWVLPNGEFVPLDTEFHEQFLAQNAKQFNETFGTEFSGTPDVMERLPAINAGFVRVRGLDNGRYNVELAAKQFAKSKKTILNQIQDNLDRIDSVSVTLLNEKGAPVDTVTIRAAELDGPDKYSKISDEIDTLRAPRGKFLPGKETEGLPGLDVPVETAQRKLDLKVKANKTKYPEALPLEYRTDDTGDYILKEDGKPLPVAKDYDLMSSPLAKESAKGIRGAEERESAVVDSLAKQLKSYHDEMAKNPDVKAGSKWYSTARTRLKKLLGDDSKFFAELLGATSARTPVENNFRYALDAYNQFKRGEFDDILAKYREGKEKWEKGDIADFLKTYTGEEPTRGQFLDWWITENDLVPTQSNGKKFGPNSRPVLRVLDGSWAAEVQGPKTPNFAGNLSGETFEATIDVWAMRTLHRLANEGKKDRWRILPENETGVSDADFYLGQKAFRKTADEIGIKPDALQAIVWFAEKDLWEKRGWTRGAGAEKSDFNSLLAETERKGDQLKIKTPQSELDFFVKADDIQPKKK